MNTKPSSQILQKDFSRITRNYKKFESGAKKLSMLTAYDFNTAKALEQAGIDTILVGDSLAMVALGHRTTREVRVDEMFSALRAVRRGAPNTRIIVDLPYETVVKDLSGVLEDSKAFVEAGAGILKIEGADSKTLETVKALRDLNIEVFAHIGYTPQDIDKPATLVRNKELLLEELSSLDNLDLVGIVLELVEPEIAKEITAKTAMITIGIGSGKDCDGQVLVTDDLLGRYPIFKPKFVKQYASQYEDAVKAFQGYISEVESNDFPN